MHVDAALTLRSPALAAAELSAVLGLEPDDSWEPTDSLARRRSPKMRRGDHGWVLRAAGTDPAEAVDTIGDRLATARPGSLRGLVAAGDVGVSVVLFTCDGPPPDPADLESGIRHLAATTGTVLARDGAGATTNSSASLLTWTSPAPPPGRG